MEINNLGKLKADLISRGWHMTAFLFQYNGVDYDVLFENIDNLLHKKEQYASVLLTFIDINNANRSYQFEANQLKMFIDVKEFREFFGIEYSLNLGDVIAQFYDYFLEHIPTTATLNLPERQKDEMARRLAQNEKRDPNAIYCYDARRLGLRDGKQMNRSVFISNLTEIRKPELFRYFANEPSVTFYFSPDPEKELSDIEIIDNFRARENTKGEP